MVLHTLSPPELVATTTTTKIGNEIVVWLELFSSRDSRYCRHQRRTIGLINLVRRQIFSYRSWGLEENIHSSVQRHLKVSRCRLAGSDWYIRQRDGRGGRSLSGHNIDRFVFAVSRIGILGSVAPTIFICHSKRWTVECHFVTPMKYHLFVHRWLVE